MQPMIFYNNFLGLTMLNLTDISGPKIHVQFADSDRK